ncbi:MAG: twin-arginine translocase TatA/TatE family subunit [Nitriliruptor sp.]|nr:MAG: twin-arginine translocase TatA/TatE family subunit [Nitriliruptor sp.]
MRLGPTELVIILIIVMLLFGAKRLPDLAGSIGTSMKEFRKATKDALDDEDDEDVEDDADASEETSDTSADPDTDPGR